MIKQYFLQTLFIGATLIFTACSSDKSEEANSMIASNEYVLTTTSSKQYVVKKGENGFMIDELKGKVILFDIFATWCPPCQASASHLSSLQEKFKDDLIVIGITIEDHITNAKLEDFKTTYKATYEIANSPENRRLSDAIANALELGNRFPIPLVAIYKDGKLINHYLGATQEEFIESDIKTALGKE
ncbi:MAG: TlpA family protein disulfide reductase [Epsilonproteobacteria bacterium]|nr:TlpA family protein disulfide reductase [Campylobacterota bacterium]